MTNVAKLTRRPIFWGVVAVIVVAGFLRIGATSGTWVQHPVRADAADYLAYAYNLRNHGVYSRQFGEEVPTPDALRSPGYPLFLIPFSAELPTEQSIYLVTLVQAVLGTLTVLLAFLLFRTWLGEWSAVIAAMLTALSPHLVSAGTYVLTETLFCLALTALAFLASRLTSRSSFVQLLVLGVVLGCSTLVRPSLQYFLPMLCILVAVPPPPPPPQFGWRTGARMTAVVTLGFMLIFAPWIARNVTTLGHPTDSQLTTNFLHHGMYPDFTYRDVARSYGYPYKFDPRSPEISASTGNALEAIVERFVEEPGRHLQWYLFGKPAAFLGWNIVNGYGDVFVYPVTETPYAADPVFVGTRAFMRLLHGPLMALALVGAALAWIPRSRRDADGTASMAARTCSAILLYFLAIHIVGAPFPRYAVPLRPLMFGLALFAASTVLLTLLDARRSRRAALVGAS